MEISVIIPAYRPDYYIWECLNSIKEQTIDKNLFEVLIILNGEKEPYYNNILNYIEKYKLENFKLYYTEKNGVSNARNIGLDNCKGNYIAFIDDDDYIDGNYLEVLLKNILKYGKQGIVISNYLNFEEKTEAILEKTIYEKNLYTTKLLKVRKTFSYVWGKLIPKKIISGMYFNTKYKNGEDSLFMLEVSKEIKYIATSEELIFYKRRVRKSSAHFHKKTCKYIMQNNYAMLVESLKLLSQKDYSRIFILFRTLAILKGALFQLKNMKGKIWN